MLRLALFDTPLQEVSGLKALPPRMSSVASRSSTWCPIRGALSRLETPGVPIHMPAPPPLGLGGDGDVEAVLFDEAPFLKGR